MADRRESGRRAAHVQRWTRFWGSCRSAASNLAVAIRGARSPSQLICIVLQRFPQRLPGKKPAHRDRLKCAVIIAGIKPSTRFSRLLERAPPKCSLREPVECQKSLCNQTVHCTHRLPATTRTPYIMPQVGSCSGQLLIHTDKQERLLPTARRPQQQFMHLLGTLATCCAQAAPALQPTTFPDNASASPQSSSSHKSAFLSWSIQSCLSHYYAKRLGHAGQGL